MNAFLLNQIVHREHIVSTRGVVTNACALVVDMETAVSMVSAQSILHGNIEDLFVALLTSNILRIILINNDRFFFPNGFVGG